MAKVTKKEVKVVEGYTLELTEDEMGYLASILYNHFAGTCLRNGPVKSLLDALFDYGINMVDYPLRNTNSTNDEGDGYTSSYAVLDYVPKDKYKEGK
jgi:hypothetical protein